MKRTSMFLAIVVLWSVVALCGGGGGQPPQTAYLNITREVVATPSDLSPGSTFCDPSYSASLTFDPEVINADPDRYLDLAIAKSVRDILANPLYICVQDYNNTSGGFPALNGEFSHIWSPCLDTSHVYNVVFGKLRPWTTRKDLAVLRSSRTELYYNTGNGMETTPHQGLQGPAKDATWGAFSIGDDYEDLAVADGSQIRIYQNMNNGNVNGTPYTFSVGAGQILLAQMDKNIYQPNAGNQWDLVSINGNTISVRINNNNNGFNTAQDFPFGTGQYNNYVYSLAVADINNDNFNDIVAVGSQLGSPVLKVYLNNGAGVINTTPSCSISDQYVPYNAKVVVGDIGAPGVASRNDGLNDILVTGYNAPVRVFTNQGPPNYFVSPPHQYFDASGATHSVGKVMLADVENKGGLSLIYAGFYSPVGGQGYRSIFVNKHVGDPAPAPPKGVSVAATPPDQFGYRYPRVTWAANVERDINGYQLWRRVSGICGNGTWYLIAGNLSASTTEYTDWTIGTANLGSDCLAQYKLKAKDVASNLSDFSATVDVTFSSLNFKINMAGNNNIPRAYSLHEAYPNPFNPTTQIKFDLADGGFVSLAVFDLLGRTVAELVGEYREAGYYSATWNAASISSGVYFARFTVTNELGRVQFTKMDKLVLMK